MPEGDTVYRTARLLDRSLSGQALVKTDFRVPQHATADLSGGTVVETVSRGKHLLTRIDRGPDRWTLHTHLKMEGTWKVLTPRQRWPRPAHTARVVLETAGATAVGFSLGVVELLDRAAEDDVVGHLGPDLLGPDWDEERALANLTRDPSVRTPRGAPRPDDASPESGLSGEPRPCFLPGSTPHAGRRRRLTFVGWSFRWPTGCSRPTRSAPTGDDRRARDAGTVLRLPRANGQPCRRCGTPHRVEEQGPAGRERATYWCPCCQSATRTSESRSPTTPTARRATR